jgi:predicted acyltransferase
VPPVLSAADPRVAAAVDATDVDADRATRTPRRSMAIDVLRGIAIVLMVFVDVPGDPRHTPTQLQHVTWSGVHLADFVFPAFLVAAGAALGLGSRVIGVRSAMWRAGRLFAIGLVLVVIKEWQISFESGTLQLIAVAWLIGALAMRLPPRRRVALAFALMAAAIAVHWGNWGMAGIEKVVDSRVFGERSDLGLLGMVSAGTAVMLASAASQSLRVRDAFGRARALALSGAALLVSGVVLGVAGVAMVKRLWSPSYVLVTVGAVFVLWAVLECVFVRDRRWAQPLVALGRNALAVYVAMSLIGSLTPDWLSRGAVTWAGGAIGSGPATLAWSAAVALVLTAAAELLRRRNLMIRL